MEDILTLVLAISVFAVTSDTSHVLPHVTHYEVVRPVKLNNRVKRNVPEQDGERRFPGKLAYKLFFNERDHIVILQKNRHLIGKNYTETVYKGDGTAVTTFPNQQDHCYYHGHIQGLEDSSVSVGVCRGINGFIQVNQQVYLIEPLKDGDEQDHAVYEAQHVNGCSSQGAACGLHSSREAAGGGGVDGGADPRVAGVFRPSGQQKKTKFNTPHYVELYLVVDNTEFRRYRTTEDVRTRIQGIANHVNKFYKAVNIHVMLVGLEIWSDQDRFVINDNEGKTLDHFLDWLRTDMTRRVHFDSAQLITGVDFSGETVGLATKYAMCTDKSAGVNQDYHDNSLALAATVAHELGHTLGMSHDEQGCSCGFTGEKCIMTDTVDKTRSTFPNLFSDCSLRQLNEFLNSPALGCIQEPPRADSLYGGAICGNGLLDYGEECDCGPEEECENPCCDASNCRLTPGSQCAEGQCCHNCQIQPPGVMCRAAAHDCDLTEYCSGDSASCPEDSFKMNGMPCNYGDGYCYNGQCPSPDGHCKRIWGPDARSPPECFHRNTRGVKEAHCGKTGRTYKRCADRDMVCGKLFCHGGNNHPFLGLAGKFEGTNCNFVSDDTDDHGYSMVPTGSKCGYNRVCYNQMCQDVKVYGNENCSTKCNNHGVCNHRGECHCDPGWAPPYCITRQPGSHGTSPVMIGVCAAIGLLLLLALVVGMASLRGRGKALHLLICKCRKPRYGKPSQVYQRGQTTSAPDTQLSQPLHISQPVFLETTSTRMDAPSVITVMPSRPAPHPPQKPQSQLSSTQTRPLPPPKPSPATPSNLAHKPTPPPVPRLKPTPQNGDPTQAQSTGEGKKALRPPTVQR